MNVSGQAQLANIRLNALAQRALTRQHQARCRITFDHLGKHPDEKGMVFWFLKSPNMAKYARSRVQTQLVTQLVPVAIDNVLMNINSVSYYAEAPVREGALAKQVRCCIVRTPDQVRGILENQAPHCGPVHAAWQSLRTAFPSAMAVRNALLDSLRTRGTHYEPREKLRVAVNG